MPRILGVSENTLRMHDTLSDSELEFTHRMPTTKERTSYLNECYQRKGKKAEYRPVEPRRKYGLRLVTGIRDGDFVMMEDGKQAPLSSNPESEHYRKDWKEIIFREAGELVELLAARVFDGFATILGHDEEQEQADGPALSQEAAKALHDFLEDNEGTAADLASMLGQGEYEEMRDTLAGIAELDDPGNG